MTCRLLLTGETSGRIGDHGIHKGVRDMTETTIHYDGLIKVE